MLRVDLDKANIIKDDLQKQENKLLGSIKKLSGVDVEVWAATSVAKAFDKLSLPYDRTPTGQPKFDKNFCRHMIPLWLRWLWSVVRLTKQEPRSLKVYQAFVPREDSC